MTDSSLGLGPERPSFRRAHSGDLDSLLPLVEAYYAFDEIPYDEHAIRRGLQELLVDSPLGGVWLIEHERGVAGYFVLTLGFDLELGGRVGILTELYLVPSARGRGFGSAAIELVEATLRAWGVHALELLAERDNSEALAFYAKLGMTAYDRVAMSKRLAT
jgi:GNAT superfamily N-acetyltransferase